MFNQFFQNPYLQFLPPQFAQQLQNQQMMDLGTALMQNSYGPANRGGMARFGDALAQWRQSQAGQGQQMMEMRMLAERMRLAEEQNQRQAGVYRGEDFASKMDAARLESQNRQFSREDETRRRGQDLRAKYASGLFPGGPTAQTPEARLAAAKAAVDAGTATPEQILLVQQSAPPADDTKQPPPKTPVEEAAGRASPSTITPASPRAARAAKGVDQMQAAMREEADFIGDMTAEELDEFERRWRDSIDTFTDMRIRTRRKQLQGARPLSRR